MSVLKKLRNNFVRNEKTTPIEQIKFNLKNKTEQKNFKKVILISTGSYNPVHNMHIKMFGLAKEELEKKYNYHVIGCYISPSHDNYVQRKLGKYAIESKDRMNMIEMCIKYFGYEKWLFLDKAEALHSKFASQRIIVSTLKDYIERECKLYLERVIYLCGWDLYLRCRGHDSFRKSKYGVCVIKRDETSRTSSIHFKNIEEKLLNEKNENVFIVESKDKTDTSLSSSTIRSKVLLNQPIDESLLCKDVVKYLNEEINYLYKLKK